MSAAQDFDADVIVVGAGPVGLTISNTLGQYGVKVLLLEKGEELIDYPRAVGMDDEFLLAAHLARAVAASRREVARQRAAWQREFARANDLQNKLQTLNDIKKN